MLFKSNKEIIKSILLKKENKYSYPIFISNSSIEKSKSLSIKHIVQSALQKKCEIKFINNRIFELSKNDVTAHFSRRSSGLAMVTSSLLNNKHLTKDFLSFNGIKVPKGKVFSKKEAALNYYLRRVSKVPQVIKPLYGGQGRGITTNISSENEFKTAWILAKKEHSKIIIEDFFPGDDVRVLVIGGKVAGAYLRIPAYVKGDGISSIKELITKKNNTRKLNPRLKSALIDQWELLPKYNYDLNTILNKNEIVTLTSVANIAAGGEIVELTDILHHEIIALAEKTVSLFSNIQSAGVDLLIENFQAPLSKNRIVVLEISTVPTTLSIAYPNYGKSINVAPLLIDCALKVAKENKKRKQLSAKIKLSSLNKEVLSKNTISSQISLLQQEASRLNLQLYYSTEDYNVIKNLDQTITIFFRKTNSSLTSRMTRRVLANDTWLKSRLNDQNIYTLPQNRFLIKNKKDALIFAKKLGQEAIISPVNTRLKYSGITKTNLHNFKKTWNYCVSKKPSRISIIKLCNLPNFSFTWVNNEIKIIHQLFPPSIIGDGIHTINELIDLKNKKREINPYYSNHPIFISNLTLNKLKNDKLTLSSIIKKDNKIYLSDLAYAELGADRIDISTNIHSDWANLIAKIINGLYDPFSATINIQAKSLKISPFQQEYYFSSANVEIDFLAAKYATDKSRNLASSYLRSLFHMKTEK